MTLLERLGDYQTWADKAFIDVVSGMTEKEFTMDLGVPFGTIKDRCLHIMVALAFCFSKLDVEFTPSEYKSLWGYTLDEVMTKWIEFNELLAKIVNYHPLKWVASCEFYSTHWNFSRFPRL
ncbi:MAG: hypothetical protein ACXAEU_03315 [Candidatus Hodarchaeales archaeon]|jgi:uncharacterized damage-inducible protein DinB